MMPTLGKNKQKSSGQEMTENSVVFFIKWYSLTDGLNLSQAKHKL